MTKLSKTAIALFFSLTIFLNSILALRYLPLKVINNVEVTGCERTYQISRIVTPLVGRRYYQIRKKALRDNLEQLPYVNQANIEYNDGNLNISIEPSYEGIILKSSSTSYFLKDNTLSLLDQKDNSALRRMYIVLDLGDGYLNYLLKYGFDSFFQNTINALIDLDEYHNLIDKAEYDNNKSTGKGELTLKLGPLKADLRVFDSLASGRLETVIALIRNEQWRDGRSVFLSSPVNYELRSGQLVKLKG